MDSLKRHDVCNRKNTRHFKLPLSKALALNGENMRCLKCNSENCRKLEVIYEDGTTERTTEHSISNSEGSSYGESVSKSQTKLAKRCSPPEEPSMTFFGIVSIPLLLYFFYGVAPDYLPDVLMNYLGSFKGTSGFLLVIVLFVGIFLISAYISGGLYYVLGGNRKWNAYEKELAVWKKGWLCLKCGNVFQES